MVNEEHVSKLKKGVTAWNTWRGENPNIHSDLREAKLYRANLSEANLRGADLREAKLRSSP